MCVCVCLISNTGSSLATNVLLYQKGAFDPEVDRRLKRIQRIFHLS